jgi:hypothetical protein
MPRLPSRHAVAARGFVFVVQPEVFVIHYRTPAIGAKNYGHEPEAWMIGETCWPDFENRIKLKYNYREVRGEAHPRARAAALRVPPLRLSPTRVVRHVCVAMLHGLSGGRGDAPCVSRVAQGWCAQSAMGVAVNVSVINGSLRCISAVENVCVLNCRPATTRWQGKRVIAMRQRAAARNGLNVSHSTADDESKAPAAGGLSASPVDAFAIDATAVSVRLPGTSARPPKAAPAFLYPIARREADRRECCRREPAVSKCDPSTEAVGHTSPPPPAGVDAPLA